MGRRAGTIIGLLAGVSFLFLAAELSFGRQAGIRYFIAPICLVLALLILISAISAARKPKYHWVRRVG